MPSSKSIEKSPASLTGPTVRLHPTPSHEQGNPFLALPSVVGNQAMLRLFSAGMVRAKLRVSEPGDSDEQEADRVAAHVVSSRSVPTLQRKCACGGSCAQCQEEQETLVHRSALGPLRASALSIQRAATDEPTRRTAAAQEGAHRDATRHPGEHPQVVIVDDDAPSVAPGQMRKAQFLTLLQISACATADAVLESVGHSTRSCPYLKKWLEHYRHTDAQHFIRAMHKYAPETVRARSAHEAIALLNHRVERAALSWAKTGKVSGLPEHVQAELTGGGGFIGALAGFAASGFGSALLGFLGGGKTESSDGAAAEGRVQKKPRNGSSAEVSDAADVRAQLGAGHTLDARVQSRFSVAFDHDFSGVRVHTDSQAADLSSQLNARAFTIGTDVAFAGGEYQPGSLIGDALIAHELAHVVQQSGGNAATGPHTKGANVAENNQLEEEADHSAVGAVISAWTGAKPGLADITTNALPRLKSGLRLQACSAKRQQVPVKRPTAAPGKTQPPAQPPAPAAPQVPPEKSFFFEDPALQVREEEGSEIDFSHGSPEKSGITTSAQISHQVVVDKPADYSQVGGPKDPIKVTVRFAAPASEFPGGRQSSRLVAAKKAVLTALGQLFADLGTMNFADAADERRILQERARLTEALKGFTPSNPLNIYLASETEEEFRTGEFFPITARVFVNLDDVGDPAKLRTAIRIPLHNILGGANPAKGATVDPAASTTDLEKTLLHESIHALLIARSADSDTVWQKVQGQLSVAGPPAVQKMGQDLVHSYLLAQEELFAYSAVELLFPSQPAGASPAAGRQDAKPLYELYVHAAELFLGKHSSGSKTERFKLTVSDKVKGKAVPWEIAYKFPTTMPLDAKDADALKLVLGQWPLQTRRR